VSQCSLTYHPWRGELHQMLRSINMQLLAELGFTRRPESAGNESPTLSHHHYS